VHFVLVQCDEPGKQSESEVFSIEWFVIHLISFCSSINWLNS